MKLWEEKYSQGLKEEVEYERGADEAGSGMDAAKMSGRVVFVCIHVPCSPECLKAKRKVGLESKMGVRSRGTPNIMPRSLECVLTVKRQLRA